MKLYPYQEEGVRFLMARPKELKRRNHKLLADEQGLGKTAQAIVAAQRLAVKTMLVICPVSVKYNWKRQIQLWGLADEKDIHIVRDTRDSIPSSANIIVVNYDLLRYPFILKQLRSRLYDVIVFDEAHRLKNMNASRTKLVLGKQGIARQAVVKWALTGTPVQNRPIEFWPILTTMAPGVIEPHGGWVAFGRHFCEGRIDEDYGEFDPVTRKKWNFKRASNLAELRERLKPFMLRRELKDVYQQLPALMEETVYLEVPVDDHPEIIIQKNDPRIARFEDEEFDPEAEMPLATIRRIIAECKVPQVFQYLDDSLQSVDKLVVFTYHRKVTEQLAGLLSKAGYNPVVLYGGVNAEKKQKLVDRFIDDPTSRVFVGQLTASGEGIDGLQKVCATVVFAEIDWSAGGMLQAKSRLHRIGQTRPVTVRYLIADNTIERVMASVLERKNNVISRIMKTEKRSMSLEALLERVAVALETQVELLQNATPVKTTTVLDDEDEKPVKKKSKPVVVEEDDEEDEKPVKKKGKVVEDDEDEKPAKKKKAKGVTLDDLKKACKAYVDVHDKDAARALMKKHAKVSTLTEADEDDYPKLYEAFQAGLEDEE